MGMSILGISGMIIPWISWLTTSGDSEVVPDGMQSLVVPLALQANSIQAQRKWLNNFIHWNLDKCLFDISAYFYFKASSEAQCLLKYLHTIWRGSSRQFPSLRCYRDVVQTSMITSLCSFSGCVLLLSSIFSSWTYSQFHILGSMLWGIWIPSVSVTLTLCYSI
jgi:hypothetical protein